MFREYITKQSFHKTVPQMVICMCVRACTSLGHIKITKAERFIKSYLLVKKKKKRRISFLSMYPVLGWPVRECSAL